MAEGILQSERSAVYSGRAGFRLSVANLATATGVEQSIFNSLCLRMILKRKKSFHMPD